VSLEGPISRAIFIDRDGTLCEEVGYLDDVDRLSVPDRSIEAVVRAGAAGYAVVVVTNQSGVARGYFGEDLVHRVHRLVRERIEARGGRLDAVYHCPHHPEAGEGEYRRDCDCRKPKPGMLERARDELGIDLERSYMVGDSIRDIEAGHAAGTTTILVLTGYGRGELESDSTGWRVRPDHVAEDLLEAVEWILQRDGEG
jgi:D-glycero-D-manno-heptose 1,7-bisphosphate phosphatase